MSEQNKAVVRRVFEDHWNNRNADLVSELFTSDVSINTPDGVLNGHEGASALLEAYTTAFPDFHNTTEDLFADGNQVVIRWTFRGTHGGPFAGIEATGKEVSVPGGIGVFRVDGGKISEGHMSWDKYSLLQQLGALDQ